MGINVTGPGNRGSIQLDSSSTTVRQSPRTDFGTQVRNGIADGIPLGGPGLNTPTGAGGAGAGGSTGNNQQDLLNQTKSMQEMMASFNLQYLQLQEKMQAENRSFSTVSNVMKTKHDTAKSSISNVR